MRMLATLRVKLSFYCTLWLLLYYYNSNTLLLLKGIMLHFTIYTVNIKKIML